MAQAGFVRMFEGSVGNAANEGGFACAKTMALNVGVKPEHSNTVLNKPTCINQTALFDW